MRAPTGECLMSALKQPISMPLNPLMAMPRSAIAGDVPFAVEKVGDLVEQPVRLVEPARGFGTTSRLAVPVLPLGDPGKQAGDFGNRCHWVVTPLSCSPFQAADTYIPP